MRSVAAIILAFSIFSHPLARAENETREFVMSCTYGVLAGTLVGAASLAFASKPGDSMFRVARGASIGLYAGILLGLYVVYVVPGMEENPEEEPVVSLDRLPVMIRPTFGLNDLAPDGLQADFTVLRF